MSRNDITTVYVGNLPMDVTESEANRLFDDYGDIIDVQIKTGRTCCYAFIQFKDPRDARDVVHRENGCYFGDNRLKVELAHGSWGNGSASSNHALRDSFIGISHHLERQVLVTGLPSSSRARELMEHMQQAGKVCFSEVRHQDTGTIGIVEYEDMDNMEFAAKMLTCSEFINKYSRGRLEVKPYNSESWPSPRNPSLSPSRSRSPSRSPSRRHHRSRSQSQTRSRSRSRSPSRSQRHHQTRSQRRSRSRSWRHCETRSQSQTHSRSQTRTRTPSRTNDRHTRSAKSRSQ